MATRSATTSGPWLTAPSSSTQAGVRKTAKLSSPPKVRIRSWKLDCHFFWSLHVYSPSHSNIIVKSDVENVVKEIVWIADFRSPEVKVLKGIVCLMAIWLLQIMHQKGFPGTPIWRCRGHQRHPSPSSSTCLQQWVYTQHGLHHCFVLDRWTSTAYYLRTVGYLSPLLLVYVTVW